MSEARKLCVQARLAALLRRGKRLLALALPPPVAALELHHVEVEIAVTGRATADGVCPVEVGTVPAYFAERLHFFDAGRANEGSPSLDFPATRGFPYQGDGRASMLLGAYRGLRLTPLRQRTAMTLGTTRKGVIGHQAFRGSFSAP